MQTTFYSLSTVSKIIIEPEIIPTSIRIPVLQLFLVYAKKVKVVSDSSLDFSEKLTKEKDIEVVSFMYWSWI